MAKNWYPIINGKCDVCGKCIVVCPHNLLKKETGQISLENSESCIEECTKCKNICPLDAINYYDGTQESLLEAFSGVCNHH